MSSQRLRIPEDVIFRDLAGEAVILNFDTGVYFGLDAVATRMWNLIGELGDRERILKVLLAEYDVEERRLRNDLEDLIARLLENGLLKIDAGSVADGTAP